MKGGMKYNQRDIVLVPFPYSDLTAIKQRPALIISNKKLNKSQDRLCCLITSVPSKDGILIKKKDFEEGRLPFESWIKPHRIFSVDIKVIRRKLGKVEGSFYESVVKGINRYLRRD